ncbi:MAG: DEAD/DEAH box helicase [Bacteroidales bacterium]|nr:DEAD/DEAH box helicase [Bacteroidales bacterium]
MNFEELRISKPLLNAIEDLDIVYPTPIQEKSYRRITSGKDVVGIAQTGTGKTFAYLLPILNELTFSAQKQPRVLIIVPTRELVVQVMEEITKLTKYKNVVVKGVYGGANINTQKDYIFDGQTDIIVGTPGRLFDIAVLGVLKLSKIKKVVIDEVDEMLNLGFRPQIEQLLEIMTQKKQYLMFSATLSEEVEKFINKYFFEPEKIVIEQNSAPLEKISQVHYLIPNFTTKINLLKEILKNNDKCLKNLVFVSTKKQADLLFEKINSSFENKIGIIHSNKSQNYRFNSIRNFEKGKIKTLIATDVVAKGLDFSNISHVINFTLPEDSLDYIHRIGRTGRADKTGNVISMIAPYEEDAFQQIMKFLGNNSILEKLPENIEISKQLFEDERPVIKQKNYLKTPSLEKTGGAFHEKKDIKEIKKEKKLKEKNLRRK